MLETHDIFSGKQSSGTSPVVVDAESSLIRSNNDREESFGGAFSFALSQGPAWMEANEISEVADTLLGLQRRTVLVDSLDRGVVGRK